MVQPIEQDVADWFKGRLARIKASDGYSMTLAKGAIFVDGDPPGEQEPPVPYAYIDDDQIQWSRVEAQAKAQSAFASYELGVVVTVAAAPASYKRTARLVASDVARACAYSHEALDEPLPAGVVSILPASAARARQPGEAGNYMQVAIAFTVTLVSDLRARPVPSN